MTSTAPTLPFVVVQAYKPSVSQETIAATATATATNNISNPPSTATITATAIRGGPNTATMIRSSSSAGLQHPPRSVSSDISHLRGISSAGAGAGTGMGVEQGILGSSGGSGGHPHSVGMLRSATAPVADHHHHNLFTAVSSTAAPTSTTATLGMSVPAESLPLTNASLQSSAIQARILHPQVHYIFENDPLEAEILDSIPKSQSIFMDFDPRSGGIKNVESYLTHLQVMDIRLVQSYGQSQQQGVMVKGGGGSTTSLSSSASNNNALTTSSPTGAGEFGSNSTVDKGASQAPSAAVSQPSPSSFLTSSTLQSSFRTSRRSTEKCLDDRGASVLPSTASSASTSGPAANTATTTPAAIVRSASKDLTLVIDAVELDQRDQESDSQLLEQSMVSSLDTDLIPENYLVHCEALLKSFSARNVLLRKVIDYAHSTTSPSNIPQ
ncbi:hypothetical protein FBU30_005358 [Linnemannia zychae]|nr:hypothetical protein FBU30_005358 [Linnemannia zychae]